MPPAICIYFLFIYPYSVFVTLCLPSWSLLQTHSKVSWPQSDLHLRFLHPQTIEPQSRTYNHQRYWETSFQLSSWPFSSSPPSTFPASSQQSPWNFLLQSIPPDALPPPWHSYSPLSWVSLGAYYLRWTSCHSVARHCGWFWNRGYPR